MSNLCHTGLRAARAGMFRSLKVSGAKVSNGEKIGIISDPSAPHDDLVCSNIRRPVSALT
jgi:hypothetical protein